MLPCCLITHFRCYNMVVLLCFSQSINDGWMLVFICQPSHQENPTPFAVLLE
uniref:Uncharacterized protein n=1 Tax=Arundo donax TaxID=35708 RepID=A0A0A9I7X1_ARUDO